jgi:hypothetical protein
MGWNLAAPLKACLSFLTSLWAWLMGRAEHTKNVIVSLRAKALARIMQASGSRLVTSLQAKLLRTLDRRRALVQARPAGFWANTHAIVNMGEINVIIGSIVLALIAFAILASFAAPFFDFNRQLVENLTAADTGHVVGDSIVVVFGMIVAILGPLFYIGLILGVLAAPAVVGVARHRSRRGGGGGSRRRRR